jgi:hypothetical protein
MRGVGVTIHNEPKSARLTRLMIAAGTFPKASKIFPAAAVRLRPSRATAAATTNTHTAQSGGPRDRGERC